MSIDPAANELLDELGGAPAFKFTNVGDTCKGSIISVKKRQQTDFATKALMTWPDGNPKWQNVITIQPEDGGDPVAVFAKGQLLTAVKEAIVASGSKGFEENARIVIRHHELKPSDKGNPQKLFQVKYEAPVAAAVIDDEFSNL